MSRIQQCILKKVLCDAVSIKSRLVLIIIPFFILFVLIFVSFQAYRLHLRLNNMSYYWVGDIYQDSEEIGFRLTPGSRGFQVREDIFRIPVKIDRYGFRIPVKEPAETKIERGGIAGIGCSFMFGHGIAAEETATYLLGKDLGLPAYNLGVCSYSTATSYLWLKKNIELLKPSIIIYGFNNFHIDRSLSPTAPTGDPLLIIFKAFVSGGNRIKLNPPLKNNSLLAHYSHRKTYYKNSFEGSETHFTMDRYKRLVFEVLDAYHKRLFLNIVKKFYVNEISDYDFSLQMFAKMLRLCEDHGAKLIVFYMPYKFGEQCSDGVIKASKELSENNNFLFIDPSEDLFKMVANEMGFSELFLLNRLDNHPNERWNEQLVKSIVKKINKVNN